MPILQGGEIKPDLRSGQRAEVYPVRQYERAIQTAFRQVADALAARGSHDHEIEAREHDTLADLCRLGLSELRYRTGIDSYLSALIAQNDLSLRANR
ncbi:hypothetical protein [Caballeronia catudaia]|uniref:hypothetical protein n=1 Tax=Caballeronia catudaia TaxID=1777136 RepID=UPI001180602E